MIEEKERLFSFMSFSFWPCFGSSFMVGHVAYFQSLCFGTCLLLLYTPRGFFVRFSKVVTLPHINKMAVSIS